MESETTAADLQQEIEILRQKLEEANDTIEAIRSGQIDALVVKENDKHQLYTLKSADQTYRVFIEKMIEGAITLNKDGVIIYSNSRFAEMLGISLSKIIGAHFENFVPAQCTEIFQNLVQKGWNTESKGEIYLQGANRKHVPVLISLNTLEVDDSIALSLILTDLTIQKDIEKELKEKNALLVSANALTSDLNNQLEFKVKERTNELLTSREHFKFLADSIPVMVYTATPNGDYDYFNQQWYNYTGKTYEESKGNGWQSVVHPEDLPNAIIEWQRCLQTGTPFRIEDRKRLANGSYRWHLGQALPFKDSDGNIVKWFGVCTDIEEQKKAMEKKDDFISMASHELKTPVTSLKGFTQILIMTLAGEGNTVASGMLEKMDKQINKLTGLIGDLLDVSKANSGQMNFQKEEFDFNMLIMEIVEEMQRTSQFHSFDITLSSTIYVSGDRNRIGQVVTNLISNAIKYSPNSNKIAIRSSVVDNHIKFCVQDFGIGIPASEQSKLFTRFFRVTNNHSITFPGLGLGLYICNEIIKRHSGTIEFTSAEHKGSTFCFTLPLQENPS